VTNGARSELLFLGIKQALMDRRRQLEFSIYPYESHTRKLISKLMDLKELANNYVVLLKQMETYRWSVSVGEWRSSACANIFYTWTGFLFYEFRRLSNIYASSVDIISVQRGGELLFARNLGEMLLLRVSRKYVR